MSTLLPPRTRLPRRWLAFRCVSVGSTAHAILPRTPFRLRSPHFDPKKHLKKIGLANQTTMYKKETQAIGRLFEKTMMAAYGAENIKERFAAFDTICDATQVRQDAITEMSESSDAKDLDFILVVGGWDSSNTAHLLEIPVDAGLPAFHVNEPGKRTASIRKAT